MIFSPRHVIFWGSFILLLSSCGQGEEIEANDAASAQNIMIDDASSASNEGAVGSNELQAEAQSIRQAAAEAVQIIEDDAQQEIDNIAPAVDSVSTFDDAIKKIE